ncbi:MAG: hypothetical protein QOE90_3104 [Thermoplasmata archaeon]|nr:hypothetical protein [Thermoplasmata archaeon]
MTRKINVVELGVSLPSKLRIGFVQLRGPFPEDKRIGTAKGGRTALVWRSPAARERRLSRALALIDALNLHKDSEYRRPDIIIFPEYSIPLTQVSISALQAKADTNNQVIIAGSDNIDDAPVADGCIIIPKQTPRFVRKLQPSTWERFLTPAPPDAPIDVFSWQYGGQRYLLSLRVCLDFRGFNANSFDAPALVVVPMHSREVRKFQDEAHDLLGNSKHGIITFLCNAIGQSAEGNSSVVAMATMATADKPAIQFPRDREACAVLEVDLDDLRMNRVTPSHVPERGVGLEWKFKISGEGATATIEDWIDDSPDALPIIAKQGAENTQAGSLSAAASRLRMPETGPIPGWGAFTPTDIGSLAALSPEESVLFFDGAVPTWRHAVSDSIPRREAVSETRRKLHSAINSKAQPSLTLIRAAGGEGKTTVLLQAAIDAAKAHGLGIVWRRFPNAKASPDSFLQLEPAKDWLVIVDEADNAVQLLREIGAALHEADRATFHFLIAARDADWIAASGDRIEWEHWFNARVAHDEAIVLRGITNADAKAIVGAWSKAGSQGLRDFERTHKDDRAEKLEKAVRDARVDDRELNGATGGAAHGSFFGGLLATRFTNKGLSAHVRKFLTNLKRIKIEGTSSTLFDALLHVAAVHGAGVGGIDENVLADLLGVDRDRVYSRVIRPLGEEAAAVRSSGRVLTRHSRVASAILVEVEKTGLGSIEEVWRRTVRQTVLTSREIRTAETFSKIVHAGPWLASALPEELALSQRRAIAIAAARAAAAAQPERLDAIADLGKTLRESGQAETASQVFRTQTPRPADRAKFADFDEHFRGTLHEWGVCEAARGSSLDHAHANAWLSGLSLSDGWEDVDIAPRQAKQSLAGLGAAFGRIVQQSHDPFGKALRATAFIGRLVNPDQTTLGYFEKHDAWADAVRAPTPASLSEAVAWIKLGVAASGRALEDPILAGIAKPDEISFHFFEARVRALRRAAGGVA